MLRDHQAPPDLARRLANRYLFESPAPSAERLIAPRYELSRNVGLRRSEAEWSKGTTLNVSRTGTAVIIHQVLQTADTWLSRLCSGDELTLFSLIEAPIDCWVVAQHDNALRLRFVPDDRAADLLSRLIEQLAALKAGHGAAEPDVAPTVAAAPGMAARRIRKPVAAVAGALLLIPIALGCNYLNAVTEPVAQSWHPAPRQGGHAGTLQRAGTATEFGATNASADEAPLSPVGATALSGPRPLVPFVATAGTEFTAVLTSRADTTEHVSAVLNGDLRDTLTAAHVLLPGGTRLSGRRLRDGDRRQDVTGVIWTEAWLPDGRLVNLSADGTGPDVSEAYVMTFRKPVSMRAPSDLAAGSRVAVTINRDLMLPAYEARQDIESASAQFLTR